MGVQYSVWDEKDYLYDEEIFKKYYNIIYHSDLSILRTWISLFDSFEFMMKVRTGNVFYCDCPFHNAKDLPVCINENSKGFCCYGCGRSGTTITLISEHFHIQMDHTINILYAYIQNDLKILNRIFSNYNSKKADMYFSLSTEKTACLNNRINRYITQNGISADNIRKMSKRLCCSKEYIKKVERTNITKNNIKHIYFLKFIVF